VELLKDLPEHSDAGLIEDVRGGNQCAFEELVRRHKDRVYRVCYGYLGEHEDARDVAQEVFIRAYRGIHGYRGHAQIYTWLHSIAVNLARNRLRDRQRKGRNRGTSLEALQASAPEAAQAATAHTNTPRQAAQQGELNEALRLCLEALPDSYRVTFVLRIYDELSYEEIAATSGVPRGTVKSRLNQARKRLRDCLRERGAL